MGKREVDSTITENDFTIDKMGRIVIIDNKELLDMVSGGVGAKEINLEERSSLLNPLVDELSLADTLGNNCNCGSGSGSGSGTGTGSGGIYV